LAIDREETLKKAEKLLRQGRLDAAIAEYVRVVEEFPRDWNTANALGDLYVRGGQHDKAAAQYGRIAQHFVQDGFYPKAAALYKKILKFRPDDESVLLQLGEMSARLGLFADAKAQLSAVAERRRARGDRRGADEIVVRIGSLDPSDFDARLNAARVLAEGGDASEAAQRYRAIAHDLFEKSREADALGALRHAVRLNPEDLAGRSQLARSYIGMGDVASAREFLDEKTAGDDPRLLLAVVDLEIRGGRREAAEPILRRALQLDATLASEAVNVGWSYCQSDPPSAFMCIDLASDVAIAQKDFQTAASILQEYVARATLQVPALLKLVEVCVDGGLEATMYETQAQLCDAYLTSGQAAEARVIAEDLVAREPWEQTHIERFRQALLMLKVSDPDTVIAERLNGQVPFLATDHFVDESEPTAWKPSEPSAGVEIEPSAETAVPPHSPATSDSVEPSKREEPPFLRETEGDVDEATEVEIDLTSALTGDEPGSATPQPKSLDEVFARARDQAGRRLGAEEAAEQLKIGRACIETGMVDEAIKALTLASRSPRHRFEAATALGRTYRQMNDLVRAVDWMERAAETPASSVEDGRALLYDLGATLEELGENARALAVYLELLADAGTYRDAQSRIDRLSRVETGS
jgi:tetratricopeptide (TPR) repeat protein